MDLTRGKQFSHRREDAVGSKTDEGQEYKAKPPEMHLNQWNIILITIDVLFLDASFLAHLVKGIHEERGSDSQKTDGNHNDT